MTTPTNAYDGELKITLYDRVYPLRINMGVIAKFKTETGKCFNSAAVDAIYAFQDSTECDNIVERAAILSRSISMEDAAILFFLAANEMDSQVQFDEIQEAVLMDGVLPRVTDNGAMTKSYPVLFVDVCYFALIGIFKKKDR